MAPREHRLRRQVVSEMHLRHWPAVGEPAVIVQALRVLHEAEDEAERTALAAWSGEAVEARARHAEGVRDGVAWVWERHAEAAGLTLIGSDEAALAPLMAAFAAFPGGVIRATRTHVVPDEAAAEALLPSLGFVASDLVSCRLGEGAAPRIWSDFRIGADGYGCLLLAANGHVANGHSGNDLSRTLQRLQELGNYRNLALLGLPVARGSWPRLNQIEQELTHLASDVARPDVTDDLLLERVSQLSLALMSISTRASFRMNATAAYARLVEERLAELDPRPVPGFPGLAEFTQRRLLPAVRTCSAHMSREAELSQRAARFAALLRTRVETRIENQNARLLASMDASAQTQLRLQQLVEGLSVVALSYYAIGLMAYLFKGLEAWDARVPAPLILGAAVPLVTLGMWGALHRMKRRMLGEGHPQGHPQEHPQEHL